MHQAKLARRYGAAVIVMAFDETGQADTLERRIEICQRCYDILTDEVGFPPEDIIFDPNIFAIATGIEEHNNYGRRLSSRRRAGSAPTCRTPGYRAACPTLLLVPRQRPGARGDPHGVSLSRHQGRPVHGHRQRRPAGRVRGNPERPARARRGRHPQPPPRRRRAPGDVRRNGQGRRQGEGRGSGLAQGHRGRSASRTRWCRASPPGSSRTPRRRASEGRAPDPGDRRPADGRHEHRRRPVRRGQDVPAAGGEVGARDEAGGGASGALHRSREGPARATQAQGQDRHRHGQGRRARHRQEHRRRGAPVQQLRGDQPRA